MLLGLEMMDVSAKRAFAEEINLSFDTEEDLTQHLIAWMGKAVGLSQAAPEQVELEVLRWLAGRFELVCYKDLPVDQLEAAVRRKVADDSHDFLFPFMEVGSAIAYLGPQTVVGPKLEFLEASTAGLIPSHSARDRMRQYWQARGAKLLTMQDTLNPDSLLEYLKEPLDILRQGSDATKAAILSLSYVVALSDGRFEVEEEHFTKLLAERLGIAPEKAQEISVGVGQAFWKHLRELEGTQAKQRNTGEELALTLRAAQLALETCGSLASFSEVVERGFVGSIHSTMGTGATFKNRMKGWNKTPLRLPLGFATGMLCFIRDRWKSDRHETLLRLTLAAIYQQHLQATGDHAEISDGDVQAYVPNREVENPSDVLAETVVGKRRTEPVRKISLEPSKLEDN